MPDNTQELDNIINSLHETSCSVIEGFDYPLSVAAGMYKCDCSALAAKQSILDWHNKQIEEVLDRLKSRSVNAQTYQQADGTQYGSMHSFQAIPLSAIEAERAILRSNNGK